MMALPWAHRRAGGSPLVLLLVLVAAAGWPASAASQKPALDHGAYDVWRTIRGERISPDGQWVLYQLAPRVGDAELVVTRGPGQAEHRVDRVTSARFSPDSRYAVLTITPAHDTVRVLRLRNTRRPDMPPDTLGILDLVSGELARVPGARSWKLPERQGSVVAYLIDAPPEPDSVAPPPDTAGAAVPVEPGVEPPPGEPGIGPPPGEPTPEPTPVGEPVEEQEEATERRERQKPDGRTLVVRDLATAAEHRYADVVDFVLSENGEALAYTASTKDGSADGVYVVDTRSGAARPLLQGEGLYRRVAISEDGRRVAFVSDRDHFSDEQPEFTLYVWRHGQESARPVALSGTTGMPNGWWVSEDGAVRFSESGRRVFFGTAPRPAPEPPPDSLLPDERVTLDVWHWQDDHIQPMQLLNAEGERKRTYEAVVHLDRRDRVVQLATPAMPSVEVGARGEGDMALAETDVPYRRWSASSPRASATCG
jgi:hypothetical protein